MKKILVFGAGMSAWYAIKYMADNAARNFLPICHVYLYKV